MTAESTSEVMIAYQAGQGAFERGQYRAAIDYLQTARSLVPKQSALEGEIQLWLVTAYDASGERDAALSLCRQLKTHGHYETRQQSKRLLYILEAPKLETKAEWITPIPELGQPDRLPKKQRAGGTMSAAAPKEPTVLPPWQQPFEPVEIQDKRFMLLAGGLCLLILLGLWQFSSGG